MDEYIHSFKITYFKKLLVIGFNNSPAIKTIVNAENDSYGEPILSMEDYNIINSFIKIDNQGMILDSINKIGNVSEGPQGKYVFSNALAIFNSKKLNSLAKARYKVFLKADDE